MNGSVILTELIPSMKNSVISFLKIRGGYGQTGNDAPTYYTSAYYYLSSAGGGFGKLTFPLNSFSGLVKSGRIPSTDLKPEISTEAEIGIDARFFNNRLSFDVALYNKMTKNQIISATLAPESGHTSAVRNHRQNTEQGYRIVRRIVPVRTRIGNGISATLSQRTTTRSSLFGMTLRSTRSTVSQRDLS